MLRKTLVALVATASLAVGAAALTPAMANYDYCYENPAAVGCPGNYDVTKEAFYVAPHSSLSRNRRSPAFESASTRLDGSGSVSAHAGVASSPIIDMTIGRTRRSMVTPCGAAALSVFLQ